MSLPPLPERETLRLHQANERTLLAWIRTALALMAFGFVIARFGLLLRELAIAHEATASRSVQSSLWLGIALASAGVVTSLASTLRFWAVARAIERHEVGAPGSVWVFIAAFSIGLLGMIVVGLLLSSA
jgi:putative membrane protein